MSTVNKIPEISYYESHITIEPVNGERLTEFERFSAMMGFKVAKLLMVKNGNGSEERSNRDSFCTGHSKDYWSLLARTEQLHDLLKEAGFKVWRYKIEGCLLDVKMERLYNIEGVKSA
jgi:hypothetical protein